MLMPKYREHAEHILGAYLQYADHSQSQCIYTATLPIGVNDGGKEKQRKEKKRNEKKWRFLELPRPMAGS